MNLQLKKQIKKQQNGRYYTPRQRFWKRLDQRLFITLTCVSLFFLFVFLYAQFADARAYKDFPAASRLIEIDGQTIFVHETGRNTRLPTVVILPGEQEDSGMWQAVQPPLADHYRVVSIDKPGFLWSDLPGEKSTPSRYAEYMAATLSELGEKDVVLVTRSLGFIAALLYRHDITAAPKLRGIVVANAVALTPRAADSLRVTYYAPALKWRKPVLSVLYRLGLGRLYGDFAGLSQGGFLYPEGVHALVNWEYAEQCAQMRYSESNLLARMRELDAPELLADFRAAARTTPNPGFPVFILQPGPVAGVADSAAAVTRTPASDRHWLRSFAEHSRGGRFIAVEGGGRVMHREQPWAVIDAVHRIMRVIEEEE